MSHWRRSPRGASAMTVAAFAMGLAFAGTADGTADVEISTDGRLGISVPAVAGSDGDHGVIVEPFRDAFRNVAFRMRQVQPGDAPFASNDPDCVVNNLFNDAVCGGPRVSGNVVMGDGADRVILVETPKDATVSDSGFSTIILVGPIPIPLFLNRPAVAICVEGVRNVGIFDVNLGGGDDVLGVVPDNQCALGSFPERGFLARLNANGGGGNDTIQGSPLSDTLNGGGGSDFVDGAGGADTIGASPGTDELHGGSGNDFFLLGSIGSAIVDGGPGTDSVSYSPTTAVVGVTIGDDSNPDGLIGLTNDKVQSTIENVTSGSGADSLSGDNGANALFGNAGNDVLRGGGGADRLEGGPGNDTLSGEFGADTLIGGTENDVLIGGPDVDTFDGGEGDDSIDARDGLRDSIICGPGTDTVTLDLREPFPLFAAGCENLSRFALDDGRPGAAVGRLLPIAADGTTAVAVACPTTAKTTCRGTLTLRGATRARRALARGRYVVRRGNRRTVGLTLSHAVPRSGSRVLAQTVERGVSRLGARSAIRTLTVRRGA